MIKSTPKKGMEARGFTLIELLVVICIIAVLAGLAVAASGSVIKKARSIKEVSGAKNLIVALNQYVGENDGRLPNSYSPGNLEGPNNTTIPDFMAKRYPVPLGPYLNWSFVGSALVGYCEIYDGRFYETTVFPSLGMNTLIGGDRSVNANCMTDYTHAQVPANTIVFASARHDPATASALERQGYFTVNQPPGSYAENGGAGNFGYVDLRHSRKGVVAFLDGSVNLLGENDFKNSKLWTGAK